MSSAKRHGFGEPSSKRSKISAESLGPYADIDRLAGKEDGEASEDLPWNWRQDPDKSFSDWTIVIEDEEGTSATYHVHKYVLAAGKHKSDYFSNVFRSGVRLSESLSSTSKISLDTLAAAAFPVMLDYMYDSQELKFTIKMLVALRYLAQYFGVRSLFLAATCDIEEHLGHLGMEAWEYNSDGSTTHFRLRMSDSQFDFAVPPTLLKQAALFRDETLVAAAADTCAADILKISTSDLLSLGIPLFIKIISSSELNSCPSEAISKIVAEFCRHFTGEIDWATLKELTKEEAIPDIDPDVSLVLLKQCAALHADAEAASDLESWHVLRNRCIDAFTPNWKEAIVAPLRSLSDRTKDTTDLAHRELPPPTQVALLEKALCEADDEVAQLQLELATLKRLRKLTRGDSRRSRP